MPGDTYQAPAFAWLHAARAAGSANLTLTQSIDASTSKARLLDGRATRRVVWAASGSKTIRLDRSAKAREVVDTLIIPPGHNLAGHRIHVLYDTNQNGAWSSSTVLSWYSRLRSTTGGLYASTSISELYRTLHEGLNVFRFPAVAYRYIGISIEGRSTNVPELGEFWLTRAWSPTGGLDTDYADTLVPNVALNRLPGGGVTAMEDGTAQRAWEFETYGAYGDDARIYDRLLVETGVTRDAWLLEPPAGGYETTVEDASATTGWTGSSATLATSSSSPWITGQAYLEVTTSANPARAFKALPSDVDLRGKILCVAVKTSSTTGATATDGIRVIPYQDGTTIASYAFGTNFITTTGSWFQLFVDCDQDSPAVQSTAGFDPSRMEGIAIDILLNAGAVVGISDIHVIDKVRAPLIVRTMRAAKATNRSGNPAGSGERRSFSFSLLEAVE